MKLKNSLKGKVAVVTGGNGFLGGEHVRALCELGAYVFIADIKHDLKNSVYVDLKKYVEPIKMDVTKQSSIRMALNKIIKKKNRIDILINNAAIDSKLDKNNLKNTSRVENFPLSQWNLELSVGLTGTFLCCKFFGSWMAKNNGGVILNISSDLSVIAPD